MLHKKTKQIRQYIEDRRWLNLRLWRKGMTTTKIARRKSFKKKKLDKSV